MRTVGFFLFLLVFCSFVDADIYKVVGDDGVILFTDAPLGKKNQKIVNDEKGKEPALSAKSNNITYAKKQTDYHSNHPIVSKKAKEHDIDPSLVSAVIKAESNGNPYAVSRKGAMGLMQLMPTTANDLRVKNPFDPEQNIDGGIRYLRYLIGKFNGNLTLALAAYNAGPKIVERYGCVPPISETKQYVKKVLAIYNGNCDVPSFAAPKVKQSEPIYKIELEDGTILFTNSPLSKTKSLRF